MFTTLISATTFVVIGASIFLFKSKDTIALAANCIPNQCVFDGTKG